MKYALVLATLTLMACASAKKEDAKPNAAAANDTDSGSNDPVVTDDNGNPVTPPPTDGGVATVTLATCLTACETASPKATAQNKQLDACFVGAACGNVCNGLGNSKTLYAPTADAGASCDTAAVDSYPITTAKQECSDCLATNAPCCAIWISIFGSAEGRALNTCANTCYSKYPN